MILFLSTPSARRATGAIYLWYTLPQYFYPRPPRGGRLCSALLMDAAEVISIHALREEGDQGNTAALSVTTIFLSTPSARRATADAPLPDGGQDISIHALREEGDSWYS